MDDPVLTTALLVPLVIKLVASAGARYRTARFGLKWGLFLYLGRIVDTDALQQRHWDINTWTDEEVKSWKDSHLASCNAIAVAGAIFASIGLTALQLPDMATVHWSARACCVASMVLGVVSVTTATKQHQAIGMLKAPLDVRLWLSRGGPTLHHQLPSILKMHEVEWAREKYVRVEGFSQLPLESSISGLKAVALPRHLLDVAVILFMFGIGLYQLHGWKADPRDPDVEGDRIGYRNVFIVFIIAIGLYIIYDLAVSMARVVDDDKRNTEFSTNTLGGLHGLEKLRELDRRLKRIRKIVGSAATLDDVRIRKERLDAISGELEAEVSNMARIERKVADFKHQNAKNLELVEERKALHERNNARLRALIAEEQQMVDAAEKADADEQSKKAQEAPLPPSSPLGDDRRPSRGQDREPKVVEEV